MVQRFVLLIAAAMVVAGCSESGSAGASTPSGAVSAFVALFKDPRSVIAGAHTEAERQRRLGGLWRSMCRRVDPDIRDNLRFDAGRPPSLLNCGATVVTMTTYTGDTERMVEPTSLSGTPVKERTTGRTSVVTVAVRYRAKPWGHVPMPPARATVDVLTVKREGGWYVATPEALNPLTARDGGLSENQLRAHHAELLAATR